MDLNSLIEKITNDIIKLQDETGCWNVLNEKEKGYPGFKHYSPVYSATLWTLIFLADIQSPAENEKLKKPLTAIANHFYDQKNNIFTIGKSHFPIPCLNGNMIYLLQYFKMNQTETVNKAIDFFVLYQRFDDGDYKTPAGAPYYSNRSCYGRHTCFWGVVKLLKGLSFVPRKNRTKSAQRLLGNCIDFILRHEVCFSSHEKSNFLHTNIKKLTFPNMYQSDFLEILWLLKRENVKEIRLSRALDLLRSKRKPNAGWDLERKINNTIIPLAKKEGSAFVSQRAAEVLAFYDHA